MPFVLVPGAWLGGWAWNDVTTALRAAGQSVYPITLTGLAERAHLARPETDLATHVADVVNLIEVEDLTDVVLVGHSYAGAVVTGAADRLADRLKALVYVDSGPIPPGGSVLAFNPPDEQARLRAQVESEGDGWLLPPVDWVILVGTPTGDGLTPDHLARLECNATPQPFATYTQPLDLPNGLPGDYGRVLVACHDARALEATGLPELQFASQPGWTRHDLQTGHWPMLSAPADLAAALLAEA